MLQVLNIPIKVMNIECVTYQNGKYLEGAQLFSLRSYKKCLVLHERLTHTYIEMEEFT